MDPNTKGLGSTIYGTVGVLTPTLTGTLTKGSGIREFVTARGPILIMKRALAMRERGSMARCKMKVT